MLIEVSQDWRVRSDSTQWILERRQPPTERRKAKGDRWVTEGYYRSLSGALGAFPEERLRHCEGEHSLSEVVELLSAMRADLAKAISPHAD